MKLGKDEESEAKKETRNAAPTKTIADCRPTRPFLCRTSEKLVRIWNEECDNRDRNMAITSNFASRKDKIM